MKVHELEIEISADGKVFAAVRGAKGKACLEYVKLIEQIVGRVESQELTSEYYEPDSDIRIAPLLKNTQRP